MKRRYKFAATIVGVMLLYPLSSGPFVKWHSGPPYSQEAIDTFVKIYGPLSWLGEKVPPVEVVLEWYLDLWRPRDADGHLMRG